MLDTHTFRLNLEPSEKTYEDGYLNFSIESNNKEAGFMKFSIESEGYSIRDKNGNDIYEIEIEYEEETRVCNISKDILGVNILANGEIMLNMSGLDVEVGKHTIILEDFATEVEKKINFEIKAREIEIEMDDTIAKGEVAEIIVKSAFSGKDARLSIEGIPKEEVTLNDEGEKMFRWDTSSSDVTVGRYNIRIEVDVDGDGKFGGVEDEKAFGYIKVVEGDVSIQLSNNTIMIGDVLEIFGESSYGNYAVILIDDKYVNKAKITDGKFEYAYETTDETEGSKKVEIFINAQIDFEIGEKVNEEWKVKNGVDAAAEFTLIAPRLITLNLPPVVAEGDDVLIHGTASGTDSIYLLVLNSKGEVIFPYEGIATATEVKSNKYEKKLIKPDVGTYTVIALHKGRDGVTDAIYDGKWVIGDERKTLEQRIDIVEDKIKRAGSDDIFMKNEFKVVNPEVRLKSKRLDIAFGENMTIVATTNVNDGAIAWVSVEKEENKEVKTVEVKNGTIIADFDTNKLSIGEWQISVNIPDRCFAEGVVNIKAPSPTPTVTSIATVTPSPITAPAATAPMPTTTTTETPGFETIFAIFALSALALGYFFSTWLFLLG